MLHKLFPLENSTVYSSTTKTEGFDIVKPKLIGAVRVVIGEIFRFERMMLENPVKEIGSWTNIFVVVKDFTVKLTL